MTMEDCYRHNERTANRNIERDCFHDEVVCHATGERRKNLINQIKKIIAELDSSRCFVHIPQPKGRKPLIKYPGYIDRRPVRIPTTRPLITSIAVHETRPTCDKRLNNSSDYSTTFLQICEELPAKTPDWEREDRKAQELRSGIIYKGCECVKRNGLQDQCPRTECGPKPECIAMNPGPCCEPALAVMGISGKREESFEKERRPYSQHSSQDVCCCRC